MPVTGTVAPRQEVSVGADVSGLIVTELNADIGDMVKKGDVLARLDASTLVTQMAQFEAQEAQNAASRAQTEAQIVDAEIGVRQAQESFDRAQKLAKSGVAAAASLDTARNSLDSARAKLNTARQGLAAVHAQAKLIAAQKSELKLRIEKAEVKAPSDGLVLAAMPSSALSFPVQGCHCSVWHGPAIRVCCRCAEMTLANIKVGAPVEVTVTGIAQPLKGAVRLIGPEISAATRLGKVYISLLKAFLSGQVLLHAAK